MPHRDTRKHSRAAAALAFAGLGLAACQTSLDRTVRTEDALRVAGFTVQPADTAERMARLDSLPLNQVLPRNVDGILTYVYADRTACQCLYIGSQAAYERYQRLRLADAGDPSMQFRTDSPWGWGP